MQMCPEDYNTVTKTLAIDVKIQIEIEETKNQFAYLLSFSPNTTGGWDPFLSPLLHWYVGQEHIRSGG